LVLGAGGLWLVHRLSALPSRRRWVERAVQDGWITQMVLFLWVFELGEGFQGSLGAAKALLGAAWRIGKW
jgi:hypothetical protein